MRSIKAMRAALGAIAVACSLGGCNDDDDPADVSGSYTIAVTSRANGCNFPNWDEGGSASGIPLEITQDGSEISGQIGGAGFFVLELFLGPGGSAPEGTVSGNELTLTSYGTRSTTEGTCAYTVNATIRATLQGDVLTGTIEYTAETNQSPDCTEREGCVSLQEFNGTRPPS